MEGEDGEDKEDSMGGDDGADGDGDPDGDDANATKAEYVKKVYVARPFVSEF